MITIKAYGKINLSLDVTGVRPDGYHEVDMIMQTVGVYDTVTMDKQPEGITLNVDDSDLPVDEGNLVYRAIDLMINEYNIQSGVKASLTKRIPVAAGMAGGSADAAVALRGMNELFELGLSNEVLMKHAVKLGADIPYCVVGGTKRCQGIGEVLSDVTAPKPASVLIATPAVLVPTKGIYTKLDAIKDYAHPDVDGMVQALNEGELNKALSLCGNVLELVSAADHESINQVIDIMFENGAMGSRMSGSGPTVFGIFCDEDKAKRAYEALENDSRIRSLYLTEFVSEEAVKNSISK